MALSLRRAGALLAAAFVTAPLVAASPAFAEEQQETLTLFNINDFHGRINASAKDLACTLEEERAKVDGPSFFLSAGDNVGASEFESFIQQDQPTIDYLNALGLEASAVGNHEFDQGFDDLTGRIAKNSKFEILGANVYKDGKRALPAYSIEEHDGFKVAVIGVVTEQTRDLVSPAGIEGVEFTDAVDEVNKVVEEMEAEGVEYDFLVAEYHAGGAKSAKAGSTIDDALLARLAEDTSPKVNAIFTGHTHKSYLYVHNGRSIIQTGEYGQNLGSVSFTKDAEGNWSAGEPTLVPTKGKSEGEGCAAYPRYVEAAKIADAAIAKGDELGSKKIGEVTGDITTAWDGSKAEYKNDKWSRKAGDESKKGDDRSSSSAISNIAAESQVWALNRDSYPGKKPDLGVMGPGSMRAELYYSEDGTVSVKNANDVMPFANNVHTVDLTGAQLKTMLEQQWRDNADRPYLQLGLSKNVSYTFDPSAEKGKHITGIWLNGTQIDLADTEKLYTVVGQSFLLDGGDEFSVFKEGKNHVDTGLLDRDTWMDYIAKNSPLTPDYSQRGAGIEFLNEDPASAGTKDNPLRVRITKLHSTSLGAPKITKAIVTIGGHTYEADYAFDETLGEWAATVDLFPHECLEAGEYDATVTAVPETGTAITLPLKVTRTGDAPANCSEGSTGEGGTDEGGSTEDGSGQGSDRGDREDSDAGTPESQPSKEHDARTPSVSSLPRTGAEVTSLVGLSAVAMIAGASVLVHRRRA